MSKITRRSFIFYESFYDSIAQLDKQVQAEIILALVRYGLKGEMEPNLKPVANALFQSFKPQIDANNKKYLNGLKGAKHGKKGGRPKTPKKPQENPKQTPNEEGVMKNDNENENENENERGKNARALDFLKEKFPSRFETEFLMRFDSKIENIEKFKMDFNDTVDQEDLEYTPKKLFARLGKYARNWVDNQHKYQNNGKPDSEPKIGRQTLSDIDANSRGW